MSRDLNRAVVPVASQSSADLHPALESAFSQVMIKMSGQSQIMTVPGIQKQLPFVEKFVQKYSYLDSNIKVTFDQHALVSLLSETQQPIWLSTRPSTLIWLSVNDLAPVVLTPEDPDPRAVILQNNAAARAIPVVFPTIENSPSTAEQSETSGGALDQVALEKIAEHYETSAILYGQLKPGVDESGLVDWVFIWRGQTWVWHDEGAQTAILQAGIDKVADLMASQLAVNLSQGARHPLWLAILGINNLTDYNAALSMLKELPPVLGVIVQDVGSHGLLLQVTVTGEGEDPLKSALWASAHFKPLSTETSESVLSYEWRP